MIFSREVEKQKKEIKEAFDNPIFKSELAKSFTNEIEQGELDLEKLFQRINETNE